MVTVRDMLRKRLTKAEDHAEEGHGDAHHASYEAPGDYPGAMVDAEGYIHRKYKVLEGEQAGMIKTEEFGPKAFGALFSLSQDFHGFHVFSGVVFLLIIMLNVASGLPMSDRKNGSRNGRKDRFVLALCRPCVGLRIPRILSDITPKFTLKRNSYGSRLYRTEEDSPQNDHYPRGDHRR